MKKIEIEKYIEDFENGVINVKKIMKQEDASLRTVNKKINEYYAAQGKERVDQRKRRGSKKK